MKPDGIIVWGVQVNGSRKPWLWGEAHRTRRDVKAAFLSNWSTPAAGLKRLKDKSYQIVKLEAQVAE